MLLIILAFILFLYLLDKTKKKKEEYKKREEDSQRKSLENLYRRFQEWEIELEETMEEFVEKGMKKYKDEKNSNIDVNAKLEDTLKEISGEEKENEELEIDIDKLLSGFKKNKNNKKVPAFTQVLKILI